MLENIRIEFLRPILNLDNANEGKIDIKQAIEMIAGSWWYVKQSTIMKFWGEMGVIEMESPDTDKIYGMQLQMFTTSQI